MAFFKKIGEKIKSDTKLQNILRICAIAVAALLVLIVICSIAGSKSPYTLVKDEYKIVSDEDSFHLLHNGKVVKAKMSGDSASIISRSLNGSAVVVETYDDEGDTAIYTVTKDKAHKVKFNGEMVSARISDDGKNFALISSDEDDDETKTILYTGSVSSGKVKQIKTKDVPTSLVLSPNGKIIVYVGVDEEEGTATLYLNKGNKEIKIGKDLNPVSVDNKGKYIYCVNEEGDLFSYNAKGKKTKVGKEVSGSVVLNLSHSELLFKSDDKYYFSSKGKEGKKIFSNLQDIIIPSASGYSSNGKVATYPVKSFKGQYVVKGDKIGILKSNLEFKEIAHDAISYAISEDGKTIYFINDDSELFLISGKKVCKKAITDEVDRIRVQRDGKGCYVVNEDEELHYVSGKNFKKKVILEDVTSISACTKDGYVFVRCEEDLYPVKGMSKKKSIGDEDVGISVNVTYSELDESDGDTYDLSTCQKGFKFKKILKEIPDNSSYFDW